MSDREIEDALKDMLEPEDSPFDDPNFDSERYEDEIIDHIRRVLPQGQKG